MTAPRLSVVMSVFNGERYLAAALDSIIGQSFTDFELIAIDDGSSDRSGEILRACGDSRVRVLTNVGNIGLTRSLNRGLVAARGSYIARHDADDVSHPERFARQVEFLDANPGIALVGARVRIIDEHGRTRAARENHPATAAGVRWALLFGNPFAHSAVTFRRSVVRDELGGYDESYEFNQDFELWSRLVELHGATNLPEPLVDYRAHDLSIAGRRDESVRDSRLRNVARNIDIQRRNIRGILRREDLADAWPPLWTGLNVGWLAAAPAPPGRVIAMLGEMYDAFCSLYPEARRDADVARGRATILAHVACECARTHRSAACAAYGAAVRTSPAVACAWGPAFAARLLLGQSGVRVVRRMRTLLRRV